MMKKYKCKECGGENLIWRGYATWDFRSQNFKVIEADDETFCDDCNAEEEPITEDV
jgi:DNA-directed RNA polymerase subunit RPC12/RpoP